LALIGLCPPPQPQPIVNPVPIMMATFERLTEGPHMGSHDLVDWVEQAAEQGLIQAGSPGYDLARQAIGKGLDSLSPQQRAVYLTQVVPVLNEVARRQFARQALISWRVGAPRVIAAARR
jgi:hypothetical protein